ncbi:hypothetical protein CCACVL1_23212 [Corchorus capsularis]|uniref:Uncharacterized protein n=1 Tax=Corchorus capsularis TaxID=210143 RepID=A0A1R3GUP3_COCAP|nr:hypothetical protein CCACVL1_23212 [Corchorus capsularis]
MADINTQVNGIVDPSCKAESWAGGMYESEKSSRQQRTKKGKKF